MERQKGSQWTDLWFAAATVDFRLAEDVTLPESATRTELTPAVNVAITRGRIVVEQDELLAIEEGRVRESDYDAGEIPELVEEIGYRHIPPEEELERCCEA